MLDKNNNLIFDPISFEEQEEIADLEDFEDQGSRGYNYRSERFFNRLVQNPDISEIFSYEVHGDPATPVFLAYAGDPTVVRYIAPSDRNRANSFTIHGHESLASPKAFDE